MEEFIPNVDPQLVFIPPSNIKETAERFDPEKWPDYEDIKASKRSVKGDMTWVDLYGLYEVRWLDNNWKVT